MLEAERILHRTLEFVHRIKALVDPDARASDEVVGDCLEDPTCHDAGDAGGLDCGKKVFGMAAAKVVEASHYFCANCVCFKVDECFASGASADEDKGMRNRVHVRHPVHEHRDNFIDVLQTGYFAIYQILCIGRIGEIVEQVPWARTDVCDQSFDRLGSLIILEHIRLDSGKCAVHGQPTRDISNCSAAIIR